MGTATKQLEWRWETFVSGWLVFPLVLLLGGCGSDSADGSDPAIASPAAGIAPAPTPSPTPTPAPTPPPPDPVPQPVNKAPVITGDPATAVVVGQAYSFQPSANDPDGDALTYSAQNLPSWASFNPSTGRLSGTPGPGSVGTYSGVTIGVSDGVTTAQLAPYAISVTQPPVAQPVSHTVRLSWSAPTKNTDGTPLVDLAEMRVSYGQRSGSYDFTLLTGSPAITSVEIQGLSSGTWYFAVKAVNTRGVESAFSDEKYKTLP